MKVLFRVFFTALACVVALGTVARADDTQKVIDYFRKKANVPPNNAITVVDVKDSAIKGAKQGFLQIGNQRQPFLMSSDGKFAVFGSVDDLSVNPFAEIAKKINLKGRPSKGPENAKVVIVEYSDFQCPYCTRGYQTLENQVVKEYGDRIRVVFKHFPLQSIHPWAEPAAVASDCVYQQKPATFWKVYDMLFQQQREITLQNYKEKVLASVKGEGIDEAALTKCIDEQKTLAQVKADQAEGQTVGVTGTPAFVINGRLLSGAQPFEAFKAIIDDELAQK